MKHISVLIKPASSLCNIRCKYCFYANVSSLREVRSFGKMKAEVAQKMIENIYQDLADGDQLTLAFQGGEPTLVGLSYFKLITTLVSEQTKDVRVQYALQTNGILINENWCRFLKAHDFLVGLSIDGHSMHHDVNRLDAKGQGTFHKVIKTKQLFDRFGITYNVLCVLTNQLAKEAKKVFQFIQDETIDFIQFISCLDDLEATKDNHNALTPKAFAGFYKELLVYWLQELREGHYISIKSFDDMLNLLVKKQVTACGMLGNCQVQYVIEADGSVYPCDFYVLDEYRMGYIQDETLQELFSKDISKQFVCERTTLTSLCETCPFLKICGEGCKRMADAVYVDASYFCGYANLLKVFIPQIEEILRLV